MKRLVLVLAVLPAAVAFAGALDQGNIAVIQDTNGNIHNAGTNPLDAMQVHFCRETAKVFFQTHPDQFDGLVTFTPKQLSTFDNIQQGTPVKLDAQGLGYTSSWNFTSQYGSAGKLGQCVFMGSLPTLPNSPDSYVPGPFGVPFGLTGVELVGHEYGHHWLMGTNFDLGDNVGPRDFIRGYENDAPNLHYSAYADSHSVMYGSFITDNGNGSFTLNGGDRKYNELDQYLMGLRASSEVSPMMVIDDGSGQGSPAIAAQKGSTRTINGTRYDVTIADIIRASGQRNPDVTTAQHCWRVAFVLVTEGNNLPTAADVQKLESYRARFTNWFTWATDGRGTMDTRLVGSGCSNAPVTSPDGGVVDAGTQSHPHDAGVSNDAGSGEIPDELQDAGQPGDTGTQGEPGEPGDEEIPPAYNHDNIGTLKPGCGCDAGGGASILFVLGAALLRRRRNAGG
ncbi:MAG: hypothetical protein ACJ790_22635 [Myxococcaceae bacterium]